MAKRRSTISLKYDAALKARRVLLGRKKLVYILVADKKFKYPDGRSKVAYIGTTRNGGWRIAQSVAKRAAAILSLHGVRTFHARVITCRPRQHVRMWLKLERAFLVEFKQLYGDVPRCNVHGKSMRERDEFEYFTRSRVRRVLEELA